jgi:hypothetical protein
VVIDVEPELCFGCGVQSGIAEARFGGGIKRDGDLDIERLGGRRLDEFRAGEKRQVFRQSVLIDA